MMQRLCTSAASRRAVSRLCGPRSLRCLSSSVKPDAKKWNAHDAGWNPSHHDDVMYENLTEEQVRRVGERSQEEFFNHIVLKTKFPEASFPPEGGVSRDMVRRKRLIYRSKQRGWLEVDLLLGTWAEANVMGLTAAEMDEYEAILNCETVDIFNYVSGVQAVPARLETPMMARLREYALSAPIGSTPSEYAAVKQKNRLT
ncbi:Flavinator of succinate dehydrogenase-domain-containing protein [Tribonema minus]|uniref:Flavinator of succinate dehydrogenase-domain-containing protein n=1 Tax=Tribonema minus TaxID=303371 RepID=A0A835YN51_9STRA|nr:Flavinator of succinate dehydrogenase-domain-containing protein [Tribonema minus]